MGAEGVSLMHRGRHGAVLRTGKNQSATGLSGSSERDGFSASRKLDISAGTGCQASCMHARGHGLRDG
jgi:hypothetical protein